MANRNSKVVIRRELQKRAEDLKGLMEQRADLVEELKAITDGAEMEKRALSEDEEKKFDEIEEKIKKIDSTIERMERARNIPAVKKQEEKEKDEDNKEQLEERAFEAYVRGEVLQERACSRTSPRAYKASRTNEVPYLLRSERSAPLY